tara:strand:+ start:3097 stop:3414 length:318 start_codon:yes stop_codon:yes gene_type:complete
LGILKWLEDYNGLTVQEVQVAEDDFVIVLISEARQPLPLGVDPPNGRMDLLGATVITDDEMEWFMGNASGCAAGKVDRRGSGASQREGRKINPAGIMTRCLMNQR